MCDVDTVMIMSRAALVLAAAGVVFGLGGAATALWAREGSRVFMDVVVAGLAGCL